ADRRCRRDLALQKSLSGGLPSPPASLVAWDMFIVSRPPAPLMTFIKLRLRHVGLALLVLLGVLAAGCTIDVPPISIQTQAPTTAQGGTGPDAPPGTSAVATTAPPATTGTTRTTAAT